MNSVFHKVLWSALWLVLASGSSSIRAYPSGHRDATTGLVLASTSTCTSECDRAYARCAAKGYGKDMKQCADDRGACYGRCSATASRSECKSACEKSYIDCGKRKDKDMKRCSDDRRVCHRRCP